MGEKMCRDGTLERTASRVSDERQFLQRRGFRDRVIFGFAI